MSETRLLSLAPCAGALVTCGVDLSTGMERFFRVAAYMRAARSSGAMTPEAAHAQQQAFGVIEYHDSETMLQMEFCPRSEATHLALTGAKALVAPISSCRVVGRVPWTSDQLRVAQAKAESLGRARQVV